MIRRTSQASLCTHHWPGPSFCVLCSVLTKTQGSRFSHWPRGQRGRQDLSGAARWPWRFGVWVTFLLLQDFTATLFPSNPLLWSRTHASEFGSICIWLRSSEHAILSPGAGLTAVALSLVSAPCPRQQGKRCPVCPCFLTPESPRSGWLWPQGEMHGSSGKDLAAGRPVLAVRALPPAVRRDLGARLPGFHALARSPSCSGIAGHLWPRPRLPGSHLRAETEADGGS